MKIVQIVKGYVWWISPFTNLNQINGMETFESIFIEAPDNVFEGWFYNYETKGFTQPILPDNYLFDDFGIPYLKPE